MEIPRQTSIIIITTNPISEIPGTELHRKKDAVVQGSPLATVHARTSPINHVSNNEATCRATGTRTDLPDLDQLGIVPRASRSTTTPNKLRNRR